jgi:hypothetical protein
VSRTPRPVAALREAWRRLHEMLWHCRFDAYLVSGSERTAGSPFEFFYGGDEPHARALARAALAEGYAFRPLGRLWAPLIEPTVERLAPRANFIAYEFSPTKEALVGRFLRRPPSFRMPLWLRVEIDLDRPPDDAAVKSKQRNMRRCIRSYGFEPELSNDLDDLKDFYDNMHLPYIRTRHNESSVVRSYAEIEALFMNGGELVFVLHEGRRVAGVLVDYSNGLPKGVIMGVRGGDEELLRIGVSDALFFYQFQRIKNRGFNRLSLGHARAFLRDGALEYKRKLGGRLADGTDSGYVRFAFLRRSLSLDAFLKNNPFVSLDDAGRLVAVVFAENADEAARADSAARFEGLDRAVALDLATHRPLRSASPKSGEEACPDHASLAV